MAERVVIILLRLRRRMLAVGAAEGAAVAGAVGGLVAADLMLAWIVAGRYPFWAGAVTALPLAGGLAALCWRRVRQALHQDALMQWLPALLAEVAGALALAAVLTGTFAHVSKNALFLIVPASAALGAIICLLRGAPISIVAALTDRQAGLSERLSTAWELIQRDEHSAFAQAVHTQAEAAAKTLGRVRFWTRTRATGAALGLAVALAALMLPWTPLESAQALLDRQWRQVSAPAGEALEEQLARLDQAIAGGQPEVAAQVSRLAELARQLHAAKPEDARQWQGRVMELDSLTDSLRRALASGKLNDQTARQVAQLVRTLEQVSAQIAEGMTTGGGTELAAGAKGILPEAPPPSPATQESPRGWTSVANPQYAALTTRPTDREPPDGHSTDGAAGPAVKQVPFDQAWRLAAEAAGKQDVPAEYRQLVRDYFSADRP